MTIYASKSRERKNTGHISPANNGQKRLVVTLSKDLRFAELRKILESYGYTMYYPHGGSSYYIFRKAGCYPITIPKHEPIKLVYVKMVKAIVESEEGK